MNLPEQRAWSAGERVSLIALCAMLSAFYDAVNRLANLSPGTMMDSSPDSAARSYPSAVSEFSPMVFPELNRMLSCEGA
jgi:hypothetical protein